MYVKASKAGYVKEKEEYVALCRGLPSWQAF